ncbi:low temperature requirement protein A [Kribbella sp. NBC_01505]|uniref:low temperature requirement protein A n=1 Tax=Kribbella sp. NBC_01505 TaxID=2903580 RepID=UPI003868C0E0
MADKTEERHASWLELFFDLTVVAAAAQISHRLHGAQSVGQIAACAAMYYAIWSVWTTTSVYANVAGEKTRRRAVLRTMLGIAIMAAAVPGVFPELGEHHGPDSRTKVFVVAFILCRAVASRSAARDGQVVAFWPATQSIAATPWLVSLLVPEPWNYALWGLAIAIDLLFSMFGARSPRWVEQETARARARQERDNERQASRLSELIRRGVAPEQLPNPKPTLVSVAQVEQGHLNERLGLFVIIVLGEALAQVVAANTDLEWTRGVVVASLAGFFILVQLWQLTTLYGFTPAPVNAKPLEPWQALPAHLGVTAAMVSIATGLGALVPEATEHVHAQDRWYLFGGILMYLLTSVFAGIAGKSPLKWFLAWVLPCVLVAVAGGVFGGHVPGWLLALAAYAVLAWFASYNQLVKR